MKIPAASSRHLSAFAIDMEYHLEQTGLFSRIDIKKTGLPKCALVIVCSLADFSITKAKIAEALERVWNEAPLGYYGEKNFYQVTIEEQVKMDFSTATDEANVTGRIEVIGLE